MKIYLKNISPYQQITQKDLAKAEEKTVKKNIQLFDFLLTEFPEGFEVETDVYVNKSKIEVDDFDLVLKPDDLVTVNQNPAWTVLIMIAINIVIGLIMNYLFKPKEPETGVSSSIYSSQSKQIEAKLGDPIPIQFGRMRRHTSLVANTYKFYKGNVEYHMLNTTLGFGDYDINKIYVNDSLISDLNVYENDEGIENETIYGLTGSTGYNPSNFATGTLDFTPVTNAASETYAKLQLSMPVTNYIILDEKGEEYDTGTFNFGIEFFLTNNTTSSTVAFSKNAEGESNLSIINGNSYTLTYQIDLIDYIELIETTKPGFEVVVVEQEIAVGCGTIDPLNPLKFVYTNQYDIQVQYTNSSDSSYVCARNISPRSFSNEDVLEGFNTMYSSYKEKMTSIDLTFFYNTEYTDFEADSTPHIKNEPITFQAAFYRTDSDQAVIFREFTYLNGAGPTSETINDLPIGQYNVFITNISSTATTDYFNGSILYNDKNTSCNATIHKSTEFNDFYNAGEMVQLFHYDAIDKTNFFTDLKDAFKNEDGIIDNKIGFISHSPSEISGVDMNPALFQNAPGPQSIAEAINDSPQDPIQVEPGGETGWTVLNANGTVVDMCLVNLNFRSGIFGVGDDEPDWLGQGGNLGDDIAVAVDITIYLREIDEDDNPTGFEKKEVLRYVESTRIQQVRTIEIPLKNGRYQIKIARYDKKQKNDQKDCVLESVVGLEYTTSLEYATDYSLVSFLVKSNVGITANAGFSLNLDTTRRTKEREYKTLRDFVLDVWTNSIYGMGESLDYLDIRDELNEPISLLLDKTENAFDTLSSTLKSFGYVIYPYLNHFVVKKEAAQHYRSLIFSSKNCTNITFSYKLRDEAETVKGVKCRYIPEDELNFETYYFPADLPEYDETILPGVNSKEQAKKMATFLFDKKRKLLKNCQVTTDLEGIVPELHSRVGVATEYLEDVIQAEGHSVVGSLVTLKQEILLKAGVEYYAIIETINNDSSEILPVSEVLVDTMTREIEILGLGLDITDEFFVTIGDKINIVEDFIISSIEPGEINEDINSATEVNIVLQQYVEDIYQEVE